MDVQHLNDTFEAINRTNGAFLLILLAYKRMKMKNETTKPKNEVV